MNFFDNPSITKPKFSLRFISLSVNWSPDQIPETVLIETLIFQIPDSDGFFGVLLNYFEEFLSLFIARSKFIVVFVVRVSLIRFKSNDFWLTYSNLNIWTVKYIRFDGSGHINLYSHDFISSCSGCWENSMWSNSFFFLGFALRQ